MKALLPVFALTAFASASAATVTLRAGETGQLGPRRVTVLRVQDSRCPPTANCVHAGEIIAKVLVSDGKKVTFLTLQWPEAKNAVWSGLKIEQANWEKRPAVTFTDRR